MTEDLTLTALARRWGITKQACGLRVKEDDFPCDLVDGKKTYPWPKVNDWWIERCVRQATANRVPSEIDRSRIRKLDADAERSEIERDRLRGRLVEVERFESALADAFGRVRARLVAFASRATPFVHGKKTPALTRAALDKMVAEVLTELREEEVPDEEPLVEVAA